MKNKITFWFIVVVLLFSCGESSESFDLFGLYTGELTATEEGTSNPETDFDPNVSISLEDCSSDCIDITIQHKAGVTIVHGEYSMTGTAYNLTLEPVEEPESLGSPWAAMGGFGTFNSETGALRMTFEVSDYSGLLGTDHVATVIATRE